MFSDSVCCLKERLFFAVEITNTRAGRKLTLLAIANDQKLNVHKKKFLRKNVFVIHNTYFFLLNRDNACELADPFPK